MSNPSRLIVVALFDRIDLLDVTGPPEVFALLQREMDEPTGYRVVLAAESLAPVTTSAGVRILPDVTFDDVSRAPVDTLIVPGAVTVGDDRTVTAVCDPSVVERVRLLAERARRVASVCVGAHILAAAGLLDGKRATTHWSTARQLASDHPQITVDADPIFIRDDRIWTGAGLTACLDLSLALVADDSDLNSPRAWHGNSSCSSNDPAAKASSACPSSRPPPAIASTTCGCTSRSI